MRARPPMPSADLAEHQCISQFPRERRRRLAAEHGLAMRGSHGQRPFEDRAFQPMRLVLHLVVNLLVDARHGDDEVG